MAHNSKIRRVFIGPLVIAAFTWGWYPGFACPATATTVHPSSPSVVGSWKGDSICVGDHPACKNETVVYRFEAVPGKSELITLLGDKILEGKRVPMGKLECQYDEAKGTLSCEFTRGQTHGIWEYKFAGDRMDGRLVLLPDQSVARRVTVRRVNEDQVPPAPGREQYS